MSVLRILDRTGDTALEWDVTDAESVEAVRVRFDEVIADGYMAVRIDSPTSGEVLRTFDPEASEIILSAPMVGG